VTFLVEEKLNLADAKKEIQLTTEQAGASCGLSTKRNRYYGDSALHFLRYEKNETAILRILPSY